MTRAEMREAGIAAGIPADVVDKMLDRGLVLRDTNPRVTLRLVLDDGADQPKRLGTLGCSDSYCDGPAGHDGQHFQWIPE